MYHRQRETSFQVLVLDALVLSLLEILWLFLLSLLFVLCLLEMPGLLEMICLLEVFVFLQPRSHGLPSFLPLEGKERPWSG